MLRLVLLGALLLVALGVAHVTGLSEYLSLRELSARRSDLEAFRSEHPVWVLVSFFLVYAATTGLNLPVAAPLGLVAGFLFGRWVGTVVVSFASTLGATLGFLLSRHLAGKKIQEAYGSRLEKLNQGFEREGPWYLFTLRLVPLVPFWLINIGMGLTRIRTSTFWWVSQVGMLPGTFVFVNAGTELGHIDPEEGITGVLTLPLVVAFVALGVFPFFARGLVRWIRRRRDADRTGEGGTTPPSSP